MDEPVARADECDLGEGRVGELVAEADKRPLRRARPAEDIEQVGPALDELEQASVCVHLLCPDLAEQVGGTTDVQSLLGGDELGERRPERVEECVLGGAESGIVEAPPEQARTQLQSGDGLVQVVVRPLGEPGVDRLLEVEQPLRDTARRRDDDDHHQLWLQEQHLDMANVRHL